MRMIRDPWILLSVGTVAIFIVYVASNPSVQPVPVVTADNSQVGVEKRPAVDLRRIDSVEQRILPDVPPGFRGGRHPAIAEEANVEVTASWSQVGTGRDKLQESVPEDVYRLYSNLRPAQSVATYSAADFSGFLPIEFEETGQVWGLDEKRVLKFLQQFHPGASMRLAAEGRRHGPDGSVGLLRATSPEHLELSFRVHAEFNLKPRVWNHPAPLSGAWYTPAYLRGRLVLNRTSGEVELFEMHLPTEQTLNVHLTVGHPRGQNHDIVRVDRMELRGPIGSEFTEPVWAEELSMSDASTRLKQAFYRFMQIEWVPPENALGRAGQSGKPILAMVLWGALDDQSC